MHPKKYQRRYIIEYTLDKDHKEWFVWDGGRHVSYVQAKDQMNKLAIQEQEFNSNKAESHKHNIICGFRIVEECIEIKLSTLTELLF